MLHHLVVLRHLYIVSLPYIFSTLIYRFSGFILPQFLKFRCDKDPLLLNTAIFCTSVPMEHSFLEVVAHPVRSIFFVTSLQYSSCFHSTKTSIIHHEGHHYCGRCHNTEETGPAETAQGGCYRLASAG